MRHRTQALLLAMICMLIPACITASGNMHRKKYVVTIETSEESGEFAIDLERLADKLGLTKEQLQNSLNMSAEPK